MEPGITEGALALIFEHCQVHLYLNQKTKQNKTKQKTKQNKTKQNKTKTKQNIYLSMKFAQFEEWMLWYILWRFQIREQSRFLNVLYHSAFKPR